MEEALARDRAAILAKLCEKFDEWITEDRPEANKQKRVGFTVSATRQR
jgi:hypothetical protein